MSICFTCTEMFGVKKFGGLGRATRMIGRELSKLGPDVFAVIPRPRDIAESAFEMDGITVISYPAFDHGAATRLLRDIGADIYHSQDASMVTYLARKACPEAAHIVTFRDPLDLNDRWIELKYGMSGNVSAKAKLGALFYSFYIDNPLVAHAVRKADGRYVPAHFLGEKVAKKYGLAEPPVFLPTPFDIPQPSEKAERPTVCFVARWDARKRPELFFELAPKFPEVRFVAVGGCSDPDRDAMLRQVYGDIPNLEMPGILNQFTTDALFEIYKESWICVNTAAREGLPNVFVEALSYGCAVLSFNDPDGFSSRFGRATTPDNLERDLRHLLTNDRWRDLGQAGYHHVSQVFPTSRSVQLHLEAYTSALEKKRHSALSAEELLAMHRHLHTANRS